MENTHGTSFRSEKINSFGSFIGGKVGGITHTKYMDAMEQHQHLELHLAEAICHM